MNKPDLQLNLYDSSCSCWDSLVPRPHPAHARRRGRVSQVQILGLALEGGVWARDYCWDTLVLHVGMQPLLGESNQRVDCVASFSGCFLLLAVWW